MNTTRMALTTALLAAGAWAAKAVAIGIAGGPGTSPLENPLFFLGLAACMVAAAACGVAWARRAALPVRIAAGLGGVVAGPLMAVLVTTLVGDRATEHWVWGEVNLWVVAALTLGLALWLDRRDATGGGRAASPRRRTEPAVR